MREKYRKVMTKGTLSMVKECLSCGLFKPDHLSTCFFKRPKKTIMQVIKNGQRTDRGDIVRCWECSSQEDYVLLPVNSLTICYCLPCIQKAFKAKTEPTEEN